MKIGILTFHRAHNYGAVLQCYALQEVLKSMGHEVWVVDYRQQFIEELYCTINSKTVLKLWCHPRTLFNYLRTGVHRFRRKMNFNKFISSYLHIDKDSKCTIQPNLDAYVIGSDQLWSLHCLGGFKDEVFLGVFEHNKQAKIIGYAISTNTQSLEVLQNDGLNEYLKKFTDLSMREQFASDFIYQNSNYKTSVCLDPTILADINIWDNIVDAKWENKKYVLLYLLRKPDAVDKQQKLRENVLSLAMRIGCEVIDMSNMDYSVIDFVSLFKYARYVVTTSFHGTVFSVLFNKPFYSIKLADGHDGRVLNLLQSLGLSDYCIDLDDRLEIKEISYSSTNKRRNELRQDSIMFLTKNLVQ